MYFNGTDWVRLPAGTSGQLLRTSGTGGAPYWFNAGSTLLGTLTIPGAAGAAFSINIGSLTNYKFLQVLFRDLDPSSTSTSRAIRLGSGSTAGTYTDVSAVGTTLKTIFVLVELSTGWAYSADAGSPGGQCYITNATSTVFVSASGNFGSTGTNQVAFYGLI
jgi:hypothetical protein